MKEKRNLLTGAGVLGAFTLWTVLIQCVDVQTVGQNGTKIGFADFNVWVHQLTGVYYVLVIACYLIFEMIPVNYRPVLIEGRLEASYPSSTTLLVLSVMPTLMFQAYRRAVNPIIRKSAAVFVIAFSAFMVIGRLISGVHWATDIIGSILLSAGLFMLYRSAATYTAKAKKADRSKNGVQ